MARERNTEQKRKKTPPRSLFQSAPAQVMAPRLMVILSTLALLAIGLVMVYSSSSITSYVEEGDALGETLKQCAFAVLGIVMAIAIVLFFNQERMQGAAGVLFWAGCCVLILVTALLGTVGLGAKRWLVLGPVSIQISEFAKIAFVMMAARIAAQYREGEIDSGLAAKLAIGMVLLPLGFVFIAQSDMGTTMICCIGLFSVVVLSGLSGRAIAVLVGLGVALGFIAVLSKSYRADRLGSFADPWADAQGTGYQLVHSFKALASGGLLGAGIGNSYEKLQYLPEAETDFIFAIIGEELGLGWRASGYHRLFGIYAWRLPHCQPGKHAIWLFVGGGPHRDDRIPGFPEHIVRGGFVPDNRQTSALYFVGRLFIAFIACSCWCASFDIL